MMLIVKKIVNSLSVSAEILILLCPYKEATFVPPQKKEAYNFYAKLSKVISAEPLISTAKDELYF